MDFELLNFFIKNIKFDIRHENLNINPRLSLLLPACSTDVFGDVYVLFLSENKNQILEFFGFDISIEYDKLSEKNTFEYLCTSSILKYSNISYCGFKGPHAKNKLHAKFNAFLKAKYVESPTAFYDKKQIYTKAIIFFERQNEYMKYREQKHLFDRVILQKNFIINAKYDHFNRFLILQGIYNVINFDQETLIRKWEEFINENWSGLRIFSISSH